MHEKVCSGCGKVFSSPYGKRKTCSEECSKNKIVAARTIYPKDTVETIKRLREEGFTVRQIASQIGCSTGYISLLVKENDLKLDEEQLKKALGLRWEKVNRYDEQGRLKCNKCGEWKNTYDFGINERSATGFSYSCKICLRKKSQEKSRKIEKEINKKDMQFIEEFLKDYKIKSPSEEGRD